MSSRFYDMIHQKAESTWSGGLVNLDNFDAWAEHWFMSAESIHDAFVAEGLTESASHVRNIIDKAKINFSYGRTK